MTTYGYDPLGNLLSVVQIGASGEMPRKRMFSYNLLSELVTSTNPETGTICYGTVPSGQAPTVSNCTGGYDANGNLQYKTDARGVKVSSTYDTLNRLTLKTYSDGTPSASFNYDQTGVWGAGTCPGTGFVQCNTIGHLSSMSTSDNKTASVFSYDALGRMTVKSSCVAMCGTDRIDQFFSYDLAGNLTSYDYGTDVGRGIYYGGHVMIYDDAARLHSLTYMSTTSAIPATLFAANKYGPVGLLESSLGNGLTETHSYDVRLRQQSYNAVITSQTSAAPSFSGVIDLWENNDVIRFPNQSIPASSMPENGTIYVGGWVGTAQSCPVASVQIYIDQNSIGAATLGVARSDVQQIVYKGDGLHTNCGFSFTGSIGVIAPGTHTVSAYATDASGNVWAIPVGANTMTVTSDPPPTGNIDGTLPGYASISTGGLLKVGGWAIDSQMHAPVGSVKILIDGVPMGYAMLGILRPDVASTYGDARYTSSGWNFSGGIGGIASGQHTVSAVVYDSGGQSFPMTTPITVVADTQSVQGSFDTAVNTANQTATIAMDGVIAGGGWAGEESNSSACAINISRIDILLDGNYLAQAQVHSTQRPDVVATAGNNQSCLNAGWNFSVAVSNVDPGYHVLTARAYDQTGGSTLISGEHNIQVNAQLSPSSVAIALPTQYAWSLGYSPNGNVTDSADSVNGDYSYLYDNLNRLTSAHSVANGLQWTYDSFGNRLTQVLTAGSGVSMYQSFSLSATNQSDGLPFDAAGNALSTGGALPSQLQYDAEERISTAAGTTYVYNAMGQRAAKYVNGGLTNVYLYDLWGHVVTDLNGSFALNRREVYVGSRHLGTYDPSGNLTYVLADWLGTERARASNSGTVCQVTTSQSFGDNQQVSGTCAPPTTAFFTGKERDTESGLDYFGARYYGSSMGRFMSPDPSGLTYANPMNPQSLNLYSYALNNPLRLVDPSGLAVCDWGSSDQGGEDYDNDDDCAKDGGTVIEDRQSVTVTADVGDDGSLINIQQSDVTSQMVPVVSNTCATPSLFPHGGGISYGGNVDAGLLAAGVTGTASAGAGVFDDANTGWSGVPSLLEEPPHMR